MTPLPTHLAHMAGHVLDWLVNRDAVEFVEVVQGDGYLEERPNFRPGFEGDSGIVGWYCANFMAGSIGERVNTGAERVVYQAMQVEGNWFNELLSSEHDLNSFRLLASRRLAAGDFARDLFKAEQAIRDYLWRVDWDRLERVLLNDGSVRICRDDLNITLH